MQKELISTYAKSRTNIYNEKVGLMPIFGVGLTSTL